MPKRMPSPERLDALAAIFKSLGDPTRLKLLAAIAAKEQCVHDLTERFDIEQSAASHQLRKLRDGDLVTARKEGRHVFYALADDHVRTLIDVGLEHVAHGRKR